MINRRNFHNLILICLISSCVYRAFHAKNSIMDNIGKSKQISDQLDPARAAAMHAMLDLAGPPPNVGDALPPFWHYAYFWEACAPVSWVVTGIRAQVISFPDLGLPRRMWAGGRSAI